MTAEDAQPRKKPWSTGSTSFLQLIPVSGKTLGPMLYLPALDVLQLLGQTWFIGCLNSVWGFLNFIGQFFKIHINLFKALGVLQRDTEDTKVTATL